MTRDSTHPDDDTPTSPPVPPPLPRRVPSTPTPTSSDFAWFTAPADPPEPSDSPTKPAKPVEPAKPASMPIEFPPEPDWPKRPAPLIPPTWPTAHRPAGSLPADWVRDGRLPTPLPVPPTPPETRPEDESPTAAYPALQAQPAAADPLQTSTPPPPAQPDQPAQVGRGRWWRPRVLVAGLVVLVVLVAGGGVLVLRPGPVKGWLAAGKASAGASRSPAAVPSPVLEPASGAPEPAAASVGKVVAPLLRSEALGTGVGVSVVDAATGSTLYSSAAGTPQTPASVTKLVTATAVLATRGPGYRIPTRVLAGPAPGEVVLVGGGDPSLAVNGTGSYPGAARLDQLAAQVKTALGGTRPTRVLVDSTLFGGPSTGPGWDPDIVSGGYGAPVTALMVDGARVTATPAQTTPRSAEPDVAAGQRFAELLGLPATAVARGTAGRGAKQLGSVQSPPLLDLIEFMLQHSDNVLGEVLLRQVALATGQPATFAGATAAERTVLADLGLPVSGLKLSDGSGLSRQDRLAPGFLTALLALVAGGRHPGLWPVYTGLPVAAWSGTLASRYAGAEATGAGVVRAKTGSLSGTDTLAGLVVDADGRLLAFAMMAEGVGDGFAADAALDRVAVALAGCGCT